MLSVRELKGWIGLPDREAGDEAFADLAELVNFLACVAPTRNI